MNNKEGFFQGTKTDRWVSQSIASLLLLAFLVAVCLILGERFAWPDKQSVFFAGLWFTGVAWVVGVFVAFGITRSHDASLWSLTPLIHRTYYWNNLRRMALFFLTIYLAVPLIVLLLLKAFKSDPLVNVSPVYSWHLVLNATLFYYATLTVPLCEAMTGKHQITSLLFLLRYPVCWLGRWVIAIGLVLGFTSRWWRPVVEPTTRQVVEILMNTDTTGHLAAFLLSPMSGIVAVAHQPEDHVGSWLMTVLLLAVLTFSIRRVYGMVTTPAYAIDGETLQYWDEHREELESAREELDLMNSFREEQFVAPFASPEIEESPADETADSFPYEEGRSPEVQVVRHKQYWLLPRARNASQTSRAFTFCRVHLWETVVLICWGLWVFGIAGKRSHPVFLGLFFACTFIACASDAFRLRTCMATATGLPLRWPKLIAADYMAVLRRKALADFFASLLLTKLVGLDASSTLVLFAHFQVMRLCWYVSIWLWSLRYAGRTTWGQMYGCVVIGAIISMLGTVILAEDEFRNAASGVFTFPLALCLLIGAAGLFVLACLCLVLSLWGRGTDAFGWPQPVKPFMVEPL